MISAPGAFVAGVAIFFIVLWDAFEAINPAPPRHAKVPPRSPVLPLHLVHVEIRNVPHP